MKNSCSHYRACFLTITKLGSRWCDFNFRYRISVTHGCSGYSTSSATDFGCQIHVNRLRNIAVLLVLAGSLLFASLFVCTEVNSYQEMASVRIGMPLAFLSVNAQKYTPLKFPQCIRVGSPWEIPMRVLWLPFLVNLFVVVGLLLGIVWAAGPRHRDRVLYAMSWLALPCAVMAVFIGAGIVGVLAAAVTGVWEEAVAGFFCAFAVVLAAYLLAPRFKLVTATAALLIGAVMAWHLVSPPSPRPEYDESTGVTSGIPTYQSIAATYTGGAMSWLVCFVLTQKRAGRG